MANVFQPVDPNASIFPRGGFLDALARSGLGEHIAAGIRQGTAERTRQAERSEDIARGFLERYLALPAEEQRAFAEQIAKIDPAAAGLLTGGAFSSSTGKRKGRGEKDAPAAAGSSPGASAIPLPAPRAETAGEARRARGEEAQIAAVEAGARGAVIDADIKEASKGLVVTDALMEARQKVRNLTGEQDIRVIDGIISGKISPGRLLPMGAEQEMLNAAQRGLTVDQYRAAAIRGVIQDEALKAAEIDLRGAQTDEINRLIEPRASALLAQAQRDREASEQNQLLQQQAIANEQGVRTLLQRYVVGGLDPATNTPIPPLADRLADPAKYAALPGDPFYGATTREEILSRVGEIIDTTGFIDENASAQILSDFNATISRVLQESLTRTTSAEPLPIGGLFSALPALGGIAARGSAVSRAEEARRQALSPPAVAAPTVPPRGPQ